MEYNLNASGFRCSSQVALATPMVERPRLEPNIGEEDVDSIFYRQIIGKLIQLTHTHPDLSYYVGIVSRFMSKPQLSHLEACKRNFRHDASTWDYGFSFEIMNPQYFRALWIAIGEEKFLQEGSLLALCLDLDLHRYLDFPRNKPPFQCPPRKLNTSPSQMHARKPCGFKFSRKTWRLKTSSPPPSSAIIKLVSPWQKISIINMHSRHIAIHSHYS